MKKFLSLFALLAFALIAAASTRAAQAQASPAPAPSAMASPMSPGASPAPSPSPSPSPSPPPHLIQFSGFLDTAYSSHIGNSTSKFTDSVATPTGQFAAFGVPFPSRVFDYYDQTPVLQNANVQAALNAGNLTGKLELSAGSDANIIQSWPGAFNGFDVTQAYLAYQLGKLSLQAGKFETLAGAEVIESPSDLNISRSILFGFAVPFTHTGGRLTYAVTPHINVIGGINAGWDEVRSANGRLTAEYGLAFNPSSAISLAAQGYTGFEQLANYTNPYNPYSTPGAVYPGVVSYPTCTVVLAPCTGAPVDSTPSGAQGQRSLIDLVGTVHPTAATTLTFNYDHGIQHDVPGPTFVLDGESLNASWSGLAGYASYNLNSKVTVSGRYEGFQDPQGYRTGFAGLFWHEATGTLAYNLTSALTLRGEYRHDTANENVFLGTNGSSVTNGNSTVEIEGLVKF